MRRQIQTRYGDGFSPKRAGYPYRADRFRITVDVDADVFPQIRESAKKENVTLAAKVREFIEWGLELEKGLKKRA